MSKQEKTITANDSKEEIVVESKPVEKTEKKPVGNGFVLFIILLVVGATVAASFYFWDLQQKQAGILKLQQQSIQNLQQQLDSVATDSKNGRETSAANNALIESLSEQIKKTEEISQQAIEIVNRNQRDWAIAEIDYLLRIAHQRIAVAKDISGAIAALKGADARIEQLSDLSLFKIRQQLAKDIASLNAIHQADVNGISLALDQVIAYLPELPFKSIKDEIKSQFTESDVAIQSKEAEKTFIDSVVETVKNIGDIKVHQRSIQAASGADQQKGIEQLLRTYLLGARLAALRFDQTQFLHEIGQASEIVRLHYDEGDNRIQQLQKTLLAYSVLELSPNLPELSKAWAMLQKEMEAPTKKTIKSAVVKKDPDKTPETVIENNTDKTEVK